MRKKGEDEAREAAAREAAGRLADRVLERLLRRAESGEDPRQETEAWLTHRFPHWMIDAVLVDTAEEAIQLSIERDGESFPEG